MKQKKHIKRIFETQYLSASIKDEKTGITLIALVITVIVLLILARSNDKYIVWRKWNHNTSTGNNI